MGSNRVRAVLAGVALSLLGAAVAVPAVMTGGASAAAGSNFLGPGEVLRPGQEIRSTNGYHLVMQADGNAVIYKPLNGGGRTAIWASNSAGQNGAYLVMQGDGNIVMYRPNRSGRTVVHSTSNTGVRLPSATDGRPGTSLVMQNDGNLVAYQPVAGGRRAVWASNTSQTSSRSAAGCPSGSLHSLCARSVAQARSDTAAQAIKFAMNQVGRPYCRPQNPCNGDGNNLGHGPQRGFDCSGLLRRAYSEAGVNIGSTFSTTQLQTGGPRRSIAVGSARPGDIVGRPGHVAMLLADGRIVEAPRPGVAVRVTAMRSELNRASMIAG